MADRRKKILVNDFEEETDAKLAEAAAKYGARVYPKLRIADVFDIDRSGLSKDEFSYALKAHFDFTVVRDGRAVFAVEFDEAHHDTDARAIYRDALKNAICEKFGMPLLRIDAGFLRPIGRFSIVGWLTEMWFLYEEACEIQARGELPYDEVFDPRFILAMADEPGISWPFDPFRPALVSLMRYRERGPIKPQTENLHAIDPHGYCVSVMLAHLRAGGAIIGQARSRQFSFAPCSSWELAEDLAVMDLVEKIRRYEHGQLAPDTGERVEWWKDRIGVWNRYK